VRLLLDLTIRSSMILLAAFAASTLLRRHSAALRHWVLAAGVFCTAAVLPLSLVLPAWDVPLPAAAATQLAPALVPAASRSASLPLDEPRGRLASVVRSAEASRYGVVQTALAPARARQVIVIVWGIGFAVGAAMLLAGLGRLVRIASRAEPLRDGRWPRLVEQVSAAYGLRRPIALLQTDAPEMLATWGLFRPSVLLPAHAGGWSEERARVVLCHELAHIRRRDWFVQISAEALRTVYWFNPLLWMACSRLRRESEQACDDVVLDAGVPAREYAAHLLDLARSCRRSTPTWASAMPIARPSTLERRIAAMLNPRLNREVLTRRAVVITLVALLAVTLPTAAFRAAAQIAPRALSGSVYDPSGAVLPQVDVTLEDAQQVKWRATTDASGRFEFASVSPGRYVLDASLLGFGSLRHEFELRKAGDWAQAITLEVGTLKETITVTAPRATGPRPPSRAGSGAPLRVGGNIRVPRKLVDVRPVYPQAMRDAGLEGVVPMEAVIDRDGAVLSVRVLSAQVHPEFAMAAVEAVRQWRFDPTLLNGERVEVVMTVSVQFSLAD
jgi:TonB family protein